MTLSAGSEMGQISLDHELIQEVIIEVKVLQIRGLYPWSIPLYEDDLKY